jgi:DNA repair ATPase RecN
LRNATQAPLPEDVAQAKDNLTKLVDILYVWNAPGLSENASKAADMLERLAQSALSYQRQIKEMSECLDQNQQRIEKLAREKEYYETGCRVECDRNKELQQRIKELEEQVKYIKQIENNADYHADINDRLNAALTEYDQLCIKAIPAHKIELIRELEQIRKARAGENTNE